MVNEKTRIWLPAAQLFAVLYGTVLSRNALMLGDHAQQASGQPLDFPRSPTAVRSRLIFRVQTLSLGRSSPVGVTRSPRRIVPRAGRAVHQPTLALAPRPRLHQRGQPQVQVVGADVGEQVPQLLLAGPP